MAIDVTNGDKCLRIQGELAVLRLDFLTAPPQSSIAAGYQDGVHVFFFRRSAIELLEILSRRT